ncbi:MAG: alcohol dehydrogenase catalytic domain-containing protein [Solirubrobacteraceae bacterium]
MAGIRHWGGAVERFEIADPRALRDGEVLIEVRASGVGYWDEVVRTGEWDLGRCPPLALGVEAAGVVRAIGAGVERWSAGDEVTTHPLPCEEFRWLPLGCRVAHELGDDGSLSTLSTRLIESARNAGELTVLPLGLVSAVVLGTVSGDLAGTRSMAEEADAPAAVGAGRAAPYGSLAVAAWEGREADVERLLLTFGQEMAARGEGEWSTADEWASAVLYNGLGRYQDAVVAAERASQQHHELGWST